VPIDLPLTNPVWVLAVATGTFLLAPVLGRAWRVPALVVQIALGALVGPHGIGLLERGETIVLLGTLGLLYLLFVVGLELDLRGFLRHRRRSLLFGALSFALPTALALLLAPLAGFGPSATLLIAAIAASHTLLAYPAAARLGVARDPAVTTAVGGSILTDVLSLTLLAVVTSLVAGGGPLAVPRLLLLLGAAAAAITLLLPRLARAFFRRTDGEASARFVFMLSAMLISAAAAQAAGAAPIIGAFLAGLALNRLVPNASTVMARVRFVGEGVFIPFFLLSVGMLVDVRVLASIETLTLAALLIALVGIGKGASALLAARALRFGRAQGWLMAGLTIPQAAATLAVTFVGLELGLFAPAMVNAVIVLILVSSLLGATLVDRAGRALALAAPLRDQDAGAPHRALVSVANPLTAEALLDVAFLLREPGSDEPILPLSVVRDEGDVEARVAAAERVLAHAVVYAAEADVPVVPLTRVALNPAVGVLQAAREQRATDVVLGWRGESRARTATYGAVIDQVIEHAAQQLLIVRIHRRIATTARAFLILPPAIDHHPGFFAAATTAQRLIVALAAPTEAFTIRGDGERLTRRFRDVPGAADLRFTTLPGWPELLRELQTRVRPEDLILWLQPRPGTAVHTPAIARMPGLLAALGTGFVAIVPSDTDLDLTPADVARRGGLAALLEPERITIALRGDLPASLATLLATLMPRERREFRATLRALVEDDVGYAVELLPGALVAHVRTSVTTPRLALGIHPDGIAHRDGLARFVLVVLLSPHEDSAQAHLARLANVVQRLHELGAERLRGVRDREEAHALLTRRDGQGDDGVGGR
jgi:Kef-type K+ transport system membrane component KefB